MLWSLLILTLTAYAAPDTRDVFERSFPRDNSFCTHNGKRLEIMIRGESKFTEPKDKGYGELLFYLKNENEGPEILKPSLFKADTFRFFIGQKTLCSKSYGYEIDSKTMAVLLLKEDRPFKDKLAIQLFDLKTFNPVDFIQTNYPATQSIQTKTGFAFKTFQENLYPDSGKVNIQNVEYIFLEKNFPQWIEFSNKTFIIIPELTFKYLEWNHFFKTEQEFLTTSGWNPEKKFFQKSIVYFAINHSIKKNCLLFLEAKQKLTGNESWICQAM